MSVVVWLLVVLAAAIYLYAGVSILLALRAIEAIEAALNDVAHEFGMKKRELPLRGPNRVPVSVIIILIWPYAAWTWRKL